MIRSFRDKDTEKVFRREGSRKLSPALQRQALRKLVILDGAETLQDLDSSRQSPGTPQTGSGGSAQHPDQRPVEDLFHVVGW